MEFRFILKEFLQNEISVINKNLLPETFNDDRRAAARCIGYVSEIIDTMGIASAKAQGLMKPITSAEKLRNCDHIIYLLSDFEANEGKGTVLGLLKVGRKNLYMFDEKGMTHEQKALCILDFYIYESSQRQGYGKCLFEYMLKEQNVLPHELAIDKPSEKLVAFFFKHYNLQHIIPQSNNFVVYEGFFSPPKSDATDGTKIRHKDADKNGTDNNEYESEAQHSFINQEKSIMHDEYGFSKYGRHAAYKRVSTMGQIMNTSLQQDLMPSDYTVNAFYDTVGHTSQSDGDAARYDLKYHHSALW